MTDNEIIKAFECQAVQRVCGDCPLRIRLAKQKEEIERLQNILLKFMDEVAKWENEKGIDVSELPLIPICDEGRDIIDHYRATAIKQFAERLKEKYPWQADYLYSTKRTVGNIDNLVKEMVGDTK